MLVNCKCNNSDTNSNHQSVLDGFSVTEDKLKQYTYIQFCLKHLDS